VSLSHEEDPKKFNHPSLRLRFGEKMEKSWHDAMYAISFGVNDSTLAIELAIRNRT
jgi:hypothetical protein